MDHRIVYANETGGVTVLIPALASGMSLEQIAAKDVPSGRPHRIVHVNDIPSDRTFRNAWVLRNNRIEHDMDKAKAIAHDKRRAARAAEFAPLDIEATIPAKAAAAEAKRQIIRDKYDRVQTQIDACATLEDLKRIMDEMK